jgi:hypothetical protein
MLSCQLDAVAIDKRNLQNASDYYALLAIARRVLWSLWMASTLQLSAQSDLERHDPVTNHAKFERLAVGPCGL